LLELDLSEYSQIEYNGDTYYYIDDGSDVGEIPELTLLSGFDPLIVSYADRSAVLPQEYRKLVINRAGVCLPSIAVNGRVAGLWNIKKNEISVEFFEKQPKRIKDEAVGMVEGIMRRARLYM